jgi:hypothetical protein
VELGAINRDMFRDIPYHFPGDARILPVESGHHVSFRVILTIPVVERPFKNLDKKDGVVQMGTEVDVGAGEDICITLRASVFSHRCSEIGDIPGSFDVLGSIGNCGDRGVEALIVRKNS